MSSRTATTMMNMALYGSKRSIAEIVRPELGDGGFPAIAVFQEQRLVATSCQCFAHRATLLQSPKNCTISPL